MLFTTHKLHRGGGEWGLVCPRGCWGHLGWWDAGSWLPNNNSNNKKNYQTTFFPLIFLFSQHTAERLFSGRDLVLEGHRGRGPERCIVHMYMLHLTAKVKRFFGWVKRWEAISDRSCNECERCHEWWTLWQNFDGTFSSIPFWNETITPHPSPVKVILAYRRIWKCDWKRTNRICPWISPSDLMSHKCQAMRTLFWTYPRNCNWRQRFVSFYFFLLERVRNLIPTKDKRGILDSWFFTLEK